jgi:hypothetical protein
MNINLFDGEIFNYNKEEDNILQMSDEEIN